MPDVDGGHGFLTTLLPLHAEPCRRVDGTITSPAHAVRELLAALPTARHSPATAASPAQSPFARSLTTHFVRFAVIDGPAFNGRPARDAIMTALRAATQGGAAEPEPPPPDALACPYLLFCADFDVLEHEDAPLRGYLLDLWRRTTDVWAAILPHCEGAHGVSTAETFADYVLSCRVETTMPFNDYPVAPPAPAGAPPLLAPAAFSALAAVVAGGLVFAALRGMPGGLAAAAAVLAGLAVFAGVLILSILRAGGRSSPWAAGTDLRTVLKALHLQAAFARFAAERQGAAAVDLQAAFEAFLHELRPDDLDDPTQPPGVVPAPVPGAAP